MKKIVIIGMLFIIVAATGFSIYHQVHLPSNTEKTRTIAIFQQ